MLAVEKNNEFCCVCAVVYFKGYACLMCRCHEAVYFIPQTVCDSVDMQRLGSEHTVV
jgi:hypothetical protein